MQWNAVYPCAVQPRGRTLLELLVTLAVAILALAIGVPAFNHLNASSRQTTQINDFVSHLHLARSSAITSGYNHVLCPSSDMRLCRDDTHWEQGYILFEDRDRNGLRDTRETLLRVNHPTDAVYIDMRSTEGRKHVTYRPNGRSAGSNLTLTFCAPKHEIPPKAVILPNRGRPRVAMAHWDGTPLNCSR